MEYLRKVVRTNKEPDEKEVLWVDTAHPDYPVMKYYENGNWKLIRQREDGVAYIMPYGGIPYSDLSQEVKMAIASGGAQANWNQTNSASPDFIWNKPYIPTALADLTEDSNHKFVSATEKTSWSNKAEVSDIPDVSDKADRVQSAVAGHIATLDSSGNLVDSGKGISDINPLWGNIQGPIENQTDLMSALGDKYEKPSTGIPASDLASGVIPDVSNFITASVDNLVNYYLKSETYTKAEVQALIGAIQQFHYEIYASTAAVTNPQGNVLYLIGPTGSGEDRYEEYVYDVTKQNPWVKIGDTSIDLSNYVTTSDLNTALSAYTTSAELSDLLEAKQDVINDLDDIRDGAAAGATAIQGIKVNGTAQSPDANKEVDIDVPKVTANTEDYWSNHGTYVPEEGEIVVYLYDHNASPQIQNNIKIGDGTTQIRWIHFCCPVIDTDLGDPVGWYNFQNKTYRLGSYGFGLEEDYDENTPEDEVAFLNAIGITEYGFYEINGTLCTVGSYNYGLVQFVNIDWGDSPVISGTYIRYGSWIPDRPVPCAWTAPKLIYEIPLTGIPKTDLASAVQTSLGKADTAYQKPVSGIPASDIADGVIPTVPTDVVKYTSQSLTDAQKGQARANIGAGTYSKPSGGIPATDLENGVQLTLDSAILGPINDDIFGRTSEEELTIKDGSIAKAKLASGVQTSLGKADSAYQKPSGGIPKTDLASAVQTSLGKADTALQSYTETDPTVPSWAKQSTKPSYSYSEISGTPTLATVATSGSYNDLSNKPTIPTVVSMAAADIATAVDTAWNAVMS